MMLNQAMEYLLNTNFKQGLNCVANIEECNYIFDIYCNVIYNEKFTKWIISNKFIMKLTTI